MLRFGMLLTNMHFLQLNRMRTGIPPRSVNFPLNLVVTDSDVTVTQIMMTLLVHDRYEGVPMIAVKIIPGT